MSNFTFNPKEKGVNYLIREKDSSFSPFFENGIGRLLTVKELAIWLACSEKTIRDWVLKGLVPVIRPRPRMVRFHLQDIRNWLAERKC